MLKVILLDDEEMLLHHLKNILQQFPNVEVVFETDSPDKVLKCFREKEANLIFADISMPEMNGLELAERIFALDPAMKLIFITAYEQYALEAFRVNAVDYILKPVTTSKIRKALEKLERIDTAMEMENVFQEKKEEVLRIIGMQNNKYYVFRPEEGKLIKTVLREQILVTAKGEYVLKNSLAYWEEKLKDHGWFRCHKAYIVNMNEIEEVYPMFNYTYNVRMKGVKEDIPVSRTFLKRFKEILDI